VINVIFSDTAACQPVGKKIGLWAVELLICFG